MYGLVTYFSSVKKLDKIEQELLDHGSEELFLRKWSVQNRMEKVYPLCMFELFVATVVLLAILS